MPKKRKKVLDKLYELCYIQHSQFPLVGRLRLGLSAVSSAGSTALARKLFDIAVVVARVYSLDSEMPLGSHCPRGSTMDGRTSPRSSRPSRKLK